MTQHIVDMYRTFAREFAPLRRVEPAKLEEPATDLASRVLAAPASARGAAIVRWLTERGLLAASVSPAMLERYFSLFDAHVALVEGFHPPAVRAPIVLWHRGQASNGESDRIGPWRRCVGSLFEERSIEGSHYDLLYPPLVTRLAAELDEVLRRAEDHAEPVPPLPRFLVEARLQPPHTSKPALGIERLLLDPLLRDGVGENQESLLADGVDDHLRDVRGLLDRAGGQARERRSACRASACGLRAERAATCGCRGRGR